MGRRYTPFDPFERSPFNVQDFTIPRPPRRFWIGVGFFGLAGLGAAALIALILSAGVGRQWQDLVLFLHYSDSGVREPLFGLDVSFYLLQLPLLHDVVNWLLGLFFMTGLLVVAAYAWRGDTFDLNLSPVAIAHLSVVLALIAFTLAASAWLGRYDLLYQH